MSGSSHEHGQLGAVEYTREVDGNTLHLFRFIHRNVMIEGPGEESNGDPYLNKIWADNYVEGTRAAAGTMDRIIVAVYPADEKERMREVLTSGE